MSAVIIGGGEINSYARASKYLKGAQIICCDSGLNHAMKLNVMPDVAIGDFDSVSQAAYEHYKSKGVYFISHPSNKDFSDMELGLTYAIANGRKKIAILGATGGRLDHTLGNIFLLHYAAQNGVNAFIADDVSETYLINKHLQISGECGKILSLIPFMGDTLVTHVKGVKYPLENELLLFSKTRGISNEFISETAEIRVENGWLLVVKML